MFIFPVYSDRWKKYLHEQQRIVLFITAVCILKKNLLNSIGVMLYLNK